MRDTELDWLFEFLGRLAKGIVEVIGPHCEVVIHDFRDLEHSVVAIEGDLTGRKPGAPIPDLSWTSEELEEIEEDMLNYCTTAKNGRAFQSSTVWIRDRRGKVVGAVCVNIDYAPLLQAREILDRICFSTMREGDLVEETFARDIDELVSIALTRFLRQERKSVDELSLDDKRRLVQALDQQGLFRVRGTADSLAVLLGVSRATIYNYRRPLS